jgi:hypothetical protein
MHPVGQNILTNKSDVPSVLLESITEVASVAHSNILGAPNTNRSRLSLPSHFQSYLSSKIYKQDPWSCSVVLFVLFYKWCSNFHSTYLCINF